MKRRPLVREYMFELIGSTKPNAGTAIYIGTERNWSAQRYDAALAKAVKLRELAVQQFKRT